MNPMQCIVEDSMVDMVVQWTDTTTRATHFTYDLVGIALQTQAWNKARLSLNPVNLCAKCNSDTMYIVKDWLRKALNPTTADAIITQQIVKQMDEEEFLSRFYPKQDDTI